MLLEIEQIEKTGGYIVVAGLLLINSLLNLTFSLGFFVQCPLVGQNIGTVPPIYKI